MEKGIKHAVKCRCIMQQFKDKPDAPLHQFIVFSLLDEDSDQIKLKFAQCDNCGLIHKVTEIGTSEILAGRESLNSIVSLDEIKIGIPPILAAILQNHHADRAMYEHASWIVSSGQWGTIIILSTDVIDGMTQGKYVTVLGETLFKVDTFIRNEIIGG